MARPPIAATFKVVYRDKSHPQQPMQLILEPPLAPYVPPDVDTALGDEALARRAKAMACTVPLHQLEANKGRMRSGEFNAYTVWGLAFVAIDTVTVQMDFDRGAMHEAVIEAVLPYARLQAPDRDEAEHREVCKWVLDELIGTSSKREFTVEYGDWNGEYVRRSFGFQLLVERQAPDGSVYLRATDAAINVLVGALDTDVESAQAAAEAKLENLVRRGRLSEAQYAAQQARYRTIQLGELIRQDLAATKRNLATVDWAGAVSPRLDGALAHIGERLEVERRIVDNIRETRDRAEESEKRAQAASLIELLDECQNRHMVLQRKLMEARQVFLAEQERQVFAPPASVRLRDITRELLLPALSLSLTDAEALLVGFFERVLGPRPERIGRLATMIAQLLTPPRERDELGAELVEPELRELTPYEAFPEPVRAAASAVLDDVGSQPTRLSTLLVAALDDSPAAAHLVALLTLHAFSPALESHLRAGDETPLLLAWSDGTPLPPVLRRGGDVFGRVFVGGRGGVALAGGDALSFYGDDLLIVRLDGGAAAHLVKEVT
ncbi:MAG: hypothetical protein ACLP7W_02370 [Solirubrobacteraceae bacterium]